jgi:hypothetical protein
MRYFAIKMPCILVALLALASCEQSKPTDPSASGAEEAQTGQVTVRIAYGPDRVDEVSVQGIGAGTTVLEVMRKIEKPAVEVTGSGANALVVGIGDLQQGNGEGWTYTVNDEFADRGAGVYEIEPGDVIRWRYGNFEPSP